MDSKEQLPGYMERINRLKKRVLETRPEIDLENARLLTEAFEQAEGKPLVVKKALAFRKQCMEKTITIWDDELIVGCSGSKIRGGILCADTCWSVLDDERKRKTSGDGTGDDSSRPAEQEPPRP